MIDTKLIEIIKELKGIEPNKDWACSVKKQLLKEESRFTFFPYFQPIFSIATTVCVVIGLFFAQNAMPGDFLYIIKKAAQESQQYFVSDNEKPAFQLKLANERLEDLANAPVKNLGPTINEFQANISKAVVNLKKIDATSSDPVMMRQIVNETKKLNDSMQILTASGVVFEEGNTAELNNAIQKLAKNLIEDLKTRTLGTEEKSKLLDEMEKIFEEGRYSEVLELYLSNQ